MALGTASETSYNLRATALHNFPYIFQFAHHLLHEANRRFGLQKDRITTFRSSMFEKEVTQTSGGQRVRQLVSKNITDFTSRPLMYI